MRWLVVSLALVAIGCGGGREVEPPPWQDEASPSLLQVWQADEQVDASRPLTPSQQVLLDELQRWRGQYCSAQGISVDAAEVLAGVLDAAARSLFDSGYPRGSALSQESENLLQAQQRRCELAAEAVIGAEAGYHFADALATEVRARVTARPPQ